MTLKRGYANGEKTIEIYEGNIDLVLYNEDGNSFYFYRFSPEDFLGESVSRELYIVYPNQVREFLERYNKEYNQLVDELLSFAIENDMRARYEM